MKTKKIKKNRGFVLLFAVMLSSIILAIALGVENIALKEINFGTSARETNNAFFAADTGAECALFNDKSNTSVFALDGTGTFPSCLGSQIPFSSPVVTDTSSATYYFIIPELGSASISCANVSVKKEDNLDGTITTTVTSKGYNNGGGQGSCIPTSNSVERELQVIY